MTTDALNVQPADLRGRVRARDPETSFDAAASITKDAAETVRGRVHELIRRYGPIEDAAIERWYEKQHELAPSMWPMVTPQRLRTARAELVRDGRVASVDREGVSPTGSSANRWAVAA